VVRLNSKRIDGLPAVRGGIGAPAMYGGIQRDLIVRLTWALFDALIWGAAMFAAGWMRFDFVATQVPVRGVLWFALTAMLGQLIVGGLVGPYAVGHQRGSFEEIVGVARTVAVVGTGLFLWALLANPILVPRSVPVSAGALALLTMFALRYAVRAVNTHRSATRKGDRRVILFGAGEAGRGLVRSMMHAGDQSFIPVAMLDDDKRMARLRFDGVKVQGTRDDLAKVASKYDATDLVIALPNADATLIRDIAERAEALGLRTMVLPPLRQIMDGRPTANDLRDVDLGDLLGRRPVELDQVAIAEQISGRTVLVTGAGGSIGSELCRQIMKFGPAKLLLLDRDESALHATQLTLAGHGLLDGDDTLLVDIRDQQALRHVFQLHQPEVVFHAAALKHLPLLERYPLEAWKTNILGTLNVLEAAEDAGVGTFVNISTDKAANPSCVLGHSKRVAERLTADFARRSMGQFVSVRFGNVLGSRGSVVPAFTEQIKQGGPVTVTHPEVERFFMLIPEACQLVLQSAAIGADGEVMVLDMGEQVRIVDVARTLIRMSGRTDIEISFTGLRAGEKLAEELFCPGETRAQTAHPLVSSVSVPMIDSDKVRGTEHANHSDAAVWMRERAHRSMEPVEAVRAGG
jgi:FlaA1/EpsC-like NDP-sugar epimerase